jgi:hypothetical protein
MRRGIRAEGFMCCPIIIIRAFTGRLSRANKQQIINQWLIRRISLTANIRTNIMTNIMTNIKSNIMTNIKSNIMTNTIKVNCFKKPSDGTQNTPNK